MKGEGRKRLERWVRQDGAKELELFLQQLRGIEEFGGKEWHSLIFCQALCIYQLFNSGGRCHHAHFTRLEN